MHIKLKAIMGLIIFAGLFTLAWWINGDINRYNHMLNENKQSDVQILRVEEVKEIKSFDPQIYEPFKPREYIRIRKRIIRQ
jgi:hypothetical protein